MHTHITSIRRYGSRYCVALACGHTLTVTADQLRQDQLYVGKRIACGELHLIESKGH